ncbi:gamma-glutamyl-gamma-aminobutyraldehyde dehydrogenase [Nocardia tenerifensis]|uniref:Gamma-glutamyl-gamma-aminobutyraldehyde dehydrogenase n=1 Tax=Nocardia tenerifensis TaxID=228006 RepID=A0A318K0W3_9NOCA|nr:aldehyde dehydrogenase family protein [Nocardia tenerifensis]PXX63918.1 gamma-glutamyl-gamma-aminobutyraldehyde dehydrogenase [Nocardia tenerifensis]
MTHSGNTIDWQVMADKIVPDARALMHGKRIDDCADTFDLLSPRDGTLLCTVPSCGQAEVDDAVAHARAEQRLGCWPRLTPRKRGEALGAWADAIEAERLDLALLVSLETGKPIRDAVEIDLRGVVRAIRWYAELADKLHGDHPAVGANDVALVSREPVGVVGILLPWNFPLALIGYDVAPALMLGNSVVVKPSERAPLSVLRCCELAVEAGVSRDALSVVPGVGRETGQAIGRHADIDSVAVTGAAATGRAIIRASGESNGKRVWPELGGKSAAVVFKDVRDIDAAAHAVAWGAYFNQGEMCTGCARVLVEREVYAEFLDAVSAEIDQLRVGDPLDWATSVGALTTDRQLRDAQLATEEAVLGGGRVLRGGMSVAPVAGGRYFAPTLLADAPESSRIFTDEVFAPVAAARPFDDVDDALRVAFSSGYGMGISVWTSSIDTAFRVTRAAKAGIAWINCFEGDDLTVPAGGVGRSGFGRTKGTAVLDKYSDVKTTWVHLGDE